MNPARLSLDAEHYHHDATDIPQMKMEALAQTQRGLRLLTLFRSNTGKLVLQEAIRASSLVDRQGKSVATPTALLVFGFKELFDEGEEIFAAERGEDSPKDVDWRAWALEMCSLLDGLDAAIATGDEKSALALLGGRFTIAEKHGITVERLGGDASGSMH